MRLGRRELTSSALALAVVAAGVLALAVSPGAPVATDGASAPDGAAAPGRAFRFEDEHAFVAGGARATFEVPEDALPADVRLWFGTAATPDREAAIALLDPSGTLVLESRLPIGSVVVGERNGVAALDDVLIAPGAWTVAYEGQGAFVGRAEVRAG